MAFKDELRKLIQQIDSDNPEDLPCMVTRLRRGSEKSHKI